MLQTLITTFLNDPFKAILGSGGVLGVLLIAARWWYDRPRVQVHSMREIFDTKLEPLIEVVITVEVENVGREATSMQPTVTLHCLNPKRERLIFPLTVQESDRALAPVTPRMLTLKAMIPAGYIFTHFRTFKFSFSRGWTSRYRVLNASGVTVGLVKFKTLEWLFHVFGILPHLRD